MFSVCACTVVVGLLVTICVSEVVGLLCLVLWLWVGLLGIGLVVTLLVYCVWGFWLFALVDVALRFVRLVLRVLIVGLSAFTVWLL